MPASTAQFRLLEITALTFTFSLQLGIEQSDLEFLTVVVGLVVAEFQFFRLLLDPIVLILDLYLNV